MTANFASGTVWTGDNLDIMRGRNDACVDLIYLDPPFNSNRTYEAPIGSKAAGAACKDAWTLDDVDVHEHGELADRNPAAYSVIEAARQAHGKGMQSYTSSSALWTSTTSCPGQRAEQITLITCNCFARAATAARTGAQWPNGGLQHEIHAEA